jgi:hypothetical protein
MATTYKSFFDLPALALPPPLRLPAGPGLPTSLPPSAAIPLAPTAAPAPLPLAPPGSDARPTAGAGMLAELANTPPVFNAEHAPFIQKAAGMFLGQTGDHETAKRILDLARPAPAPGSNNSALPATRSSLPAPSAGPGAPAPRVPTSSLSTGPDYRALAATSPMRAESPGRIGWAQGGLDAPDQRLREIALKSAQGQPLDPRELRRLAQRQGVEAQPGAFAPGAATPPSRFPGAALPPSVFQTLTSTGPSPDNPRSIEALMAKTPRPLLDSNRAADTAVDRLLRQTAASDESALRQQQIRNSQAQEADRLANLAADQARAQTAAQVEAAQTAFAQSGQPLTFENAIRAGLPPEVAARYPNEKAEQPGAGVVHDVPGIGKIVSMGNGNFQLVKPGEAAAPTQFSRLLAERRALAADPNHDPADLAALDQYIAKETMKTDAFGNVITPGTTPAAAGARGAGSGPVSMAPAAPEAAAGLPTATNPKTGEKLVFKNGQWQPLK